jgi:hypothetical protein
LFAEEIISGIIEMRGGFLLSNPHPGDGTKAELKIHRFNNPPVYNNLKGVIKRSSVITNLTL